MTKKTYSCPVTRIQYIEPIQALCVSITVSDKDAWEDACAKGNITDFDDFDDFDDTTDGETDLGGTDF